MPYANITLTQALSDLGRRLYDPDSVFWNDAEKTRYLREAVRTFASLSNFYRSNWSFNTTANQHYYDLTLLLNTNRPFTVTDVELYEIIENHLLEPPTGATWTGTAQFTIQDLLQSVQRRRNQLLSDSGCTIVRTLYAAISGRTFLGDSSIDIRRVAWVPNSNPTYTAVPLWPDDTWSLQSYERGYNDAIGEPSVYIRSDQPPISFEVNKQPIVAGNYDVLTVDVGSNLTALSPTIMNVPDDWTWVIKWGAMADLFNRDSLSRDPMRAEYCKTRYAQGRAALKQAPALLAANIENDYGVATLDIDSFQNADNFRVTWQAEAASQPDLLLVSGLNIIALASKPDAIYPITVTTMQNAPLPASGGAFFQFGREDYDAILDYSQHIAMVKCGGAEFTATMPLLQNFLRRCTYYNTKLAAMGEFTDIIYVQSQKQEQMNPVAVPAEVEE